jgi:hypothetical protein
MWHDPQWSMEMPASLERQYFVVSSTIDEIALAAGLRLGLRVSTTAPLGAVIRLPDDFLDGLAPFYCFPAIVAQLITCVTGDTARVICDECGKFFDAPDGSKICASCKRQRINATKRKSWHKNKEIWRPSSRARKTDNSIAGSGKARIS